MNAPVSTLTRASGTILPDDKQREYDEALRTFWNDGSARLLYAVQNWSIGATGQKVMPDHLHLVDERSIDADTYWLALTHVDDKTIDGYGATALGALADMMIRAEAKAAEFAQERYEDNMAGAR